jgi:hypothetical protein
LAKIHSRATKQTKKWKILIFSYLQSQNYWIFLILSKILAIYFFLHIFPSLFYPLNSQCDFSFVPFYWLQNVIPIILQILQFFFILIPLINNFIWLWERLIW